MCPEVQADKKRKKKTEAAQPATPSIWQGDNAENADPNVCAADVTTPNS